MFIVADLVSLIKHERMIILPAVNFAQYREQVERDQKVSEHDKEMPQSCIADQNTTPGIIK